MICYGPADATATPSSLASLKSRMVLSFLCQVLLEERLSDMCLFGALQATWATTAVR